MDQDSCRRSPLPFIGSIALLRRIAGEDEEWLAIWDEELGCYRFPQAERGAGESYRSCLESAVAEAFGLDQRRDFLIAGLSRAHFQAPVEWPDSPAPQWVLMQFFPVELYGRHAVEVIGERRSVRWLTMQDVHRGWTDDGAAVSPRQCELIRRADIIPVRCIAAAD